MVAERSEMPETRRGTQRTVGHVLMIVRIAASDDCEMMAMVTTVMVMAMMTTRVMPIMSTVLPSCDSLNPIQQ